MAEAAPATRRASAGLPVERFLADFHDRAPGGSTRAFAGLAVQGDDGSTHPSSYHALVSAVLAGLRRVLKPGGRLLAVVPAAPSPPQHTPQHPGQADPLTLAWLAALAALARQPRWQGVQFEGRRWRDAAAQTTLLRPGFRALKFTRLGAVQQLTPGEATGWFTGMYDLHLLSVDDRGAVEADFHARLAPLLDANGRVALPFATTLIDATAAP